MVRCPQCGAASRQVKAGSNPSGSQRYLCGSCGRKYTPAPQPNGYPLEMKKQAVLMCLAGQSFRSIALQLGVNHQTIANWIDDYVRSSARAIYRRPK